METAGLKKILIVEDDPVVVEIYRKKLQREGFNVAVAVDGLEAMKQLPLVSPDLVVLDLMMPKFNGADVLKFVRSHKDLHSLKVIIFTNAYMTELAQTAAKAGADRTLLKSNCTPTQLVGVIRELLAAAPAGKPSPVVSSKAEPVPVAKSDAEAAPPTRKEFLAGTAGTLASLQELFAAFAKTADPKFQSLRLVDFHRKVHFLAGVAGVAGCHPISNLAGALEVLLFELHERPKNISPSVIQTIRSSMDLLEQLFAHARELIDQPPLKSNALLVVDDEDMCNRALIHALSRAQLHSSSTNDPSAAFKTLQENRFDLILLDYLMPGMDGIELYTRLRQLPGYEKTPVIFVTSAADFRQRTEHILQKGDDVITKPIFPIELALKTLTLLMKARLPET